MTNEERLRIARALRELAILLRISGEARFKVRAYERGAYALEHLTRDLSELIEDRTLTSIPGIGDRLAGTIEELARTGTSRLLDRLRASVPPGTVELIDVPNLGLKKIAALHSALGIASRDELRAACAAGRVRAVPGFGERMEARILAALDTQRKPHDRFLLVAALGAVEPLITYVRSSQSVHRVDVAGSLRRCRETIGTVHLVAAASNREAVLDHFVGYPSTVETVSRTASDATIRLLTGPLAVLHVAPPSHYVNTRHYYTGSRAHIEKLVARARDRGLTLEPTGLWTAARARVAVRNEEGLYQQLGLQPVPPELREDAGEIEAAANGGLPTHLIRLGDVQGITHVHTVHSDGRNTIEEMARAAEEMGIKYLTITDHSHSAAYAGGVTRDRLQRQWDEIAAVQERVAIRLLRGTESDILRDGSLDYPDAILEQFEVIIASVHARHHLSAAQMTRRVVDAMRHPLFKIWGHPLGRLLNKRPPFDCDVERILDAIAESRAAIEINGDPYRLDLEPRWVRAARARRIPFVLSTDAHSVPALLNLRFAVSMARRGWVGRDEVLNALAPDEFAARVRPLPANGAG
jgi:DNA polymerase (family 10)